MNKTFTQKKFSTTSDQSEEIDNKNAPIEPGKQVINNILNFSKALIIMKSKSIEPIEMVLN